MPWYMIVPEHPPNGVVATGPLAFSFPHVVQIADGVVILYGLDYQALSAGVPRNDFDAEFGLTFATDFVEILPIPTALSLLQELSETWRKRGTALVNRPYRRWHLLFPDDGADVLCVELTVDRWTAYRTTRLHVQQGNPLRDRLAGGLITERGALLALGSNRPSP